MLCAGLRKGEGREGGEKRKEKKGREGGEKKKRREVREEGKEGDRRKGGREEITAASTLTGTPG